MDSESELISLTTQLLFHTYEVSWRWAVDPKAISLITQIISVVNSMDLNSQPKPESEFMSLTTQIISIFNSTDLDSQLNPLSMFISLFSREISLGYFKDSDSNSKLKMDILTLYREILFLKPEPELVSLIHKVFSLVISMNSKSGDYISLCPQVQVRMKNGKFHVVEFYSSGKWECLPVYWLKLRFTGEDATHFFCENCQGKNHEEYNKAPHEVKHYLHRKHSLELVLLANDKTRRCYCCDEDLESIFFYCLPCDFAINIACVKKPPVLSIDHPKWHEHTLALFPRRAFLTCNLCGLADTSSPLYMCPPCDFVVHLRCINLPRVIRISRHHHHLFFTFSFDHGDFSCCGVCRQQIDNDYGGYSCIKEGCLYVVHSGCATQKNVWDGKELEGQPEEDMEAVDPFVKISDGIIQHFSHQHHHLRLDEDTERDYDENKECQACIMPIYFGNFYSCTQCDFILHEECANLSLNIHHPVHPHLLQLGYKNVVDNHKTICEVCPRFCYYGFSYECSKEGCDFKLHVQCATISEPLVHESHTHPLFLTSKPEEERRRCSVCRHSKHVSTNETFNCIECDFALCFGCATLPPKVSYKHDKHILALTYGDDEIGSTSYWCELCEGSIDRRNRFYVCDEYCCVTLHMDCLFGRVLLMKFGFLSLNNKAIDVMPNNHHMSRPICCHCEKRCPYRMVLRWFGFIFCSNSCIGPFVRNKSKYLDRY